MYKENRFVFNESIKRAYYSFNADVGSDFLVSHYCDDVQEPIHPEKDEWSHRNLSLIGKRWLANTQQNY